MIKKIESLFNIKKSKEAEGCYVWMVQWNARFGRFHGDYNRVAKAFLSEEDATVFAKSLRDSQRLLQYEEDIKITITKQQ